MCTVEVYDRLLGHRDTSAELDDLETTSHSPSEYNDMELESAESAAPPSIAGENDGRAKGVDFIRGLVQYLGLEGVELEGNWPSNINKHYRIYKEAGRSFLTDLCLASHDLFPIDAMLKMTRLINKHREDGDEARCEIWKDANLLHSGCYIVMADALAIRSSAERVHPETMLALMTAIEARWWVDDWCEVDRPQHLYDLEAEKQGRDHARFTRRLEDVLQILKPEFERWYEGAAASLDGVQDALFRIYAESDA